MIHIFLFVENIILFKKFKKNILYYMDVFDFIDNQKIKQLKEKNSNINKEK